MTPRGAERQLRACHIFANALIRSNSLATLCALALQLVRDALRASIARDCSTATRAATRVRGTSQGREADERDTAEQSARKAASPKPSAWSFTRCIIALVIRTFLFQPFNIPSGSMKATLAGRRLPVRVEIHLRLQPLFAAVLAAAVLRPHLSARAPERGDVVVFRLPQRRLHRLHQARDRPAGRPHPDDRRRAPHQRPAGQARARRGYRRRPRRAAARSRVKRWKRDAAERRQLLPRSICVDNGFYDNTPVYTRAGRPLFHDGRQPRQLDRQPRAEPGRLCAVREHRRPRRRSSSSRLARASAPGRSGAGRGRCAGAGCSRSCDEPRKAEARKRHRRSGQPSAVTAAIGRRRRKRRRKRALALEDHRLRFKSDCSSVR